jgi:glutamate racemase
MDQRDRPLGVFDSGVGGFSVVQRLRSLLPDESIIYLGDTARVPYGTKSKETVLRYALESTRFLKSQGIKLLVIACNTASSMARDELLNSCEFPVIDVVEPGARFACAVSQFGRIGVIGTYATCKMKTYSQLISKLNPSFKVFEHPCPLFVPLVEEGWVQGEVPKLIAKKYLTPLVPKKIDTLILGCTHYPLLKPIIQEVITELTEREIFIVDSAEAIASQVKATLMAKDLIKSKGNNFFKAYVTDLSAHFKTLGKTFLKEEFFEIKKVSIDSL